MNRLNNFGVDFVNFQHVKKHETTALRSICNAAFKIESTQPLRVSRVAPKTLNRLRSICNAASPSSVFQKKFHLRPLLLLIFLSLPFFAKAQERVSIDDPNISFSYLLPEGYIFTDDPYYHYVYPETGNKDQLPRLTLTYFDGYCTDLNTCFDGKLNGEFRTEYADFSVGETKSMVVSNTAARWATYHFTQDGTKLEGILCTFIKFDNFFVVEAQYPATDSTKYTPVFEAIIESIDVVKR